MAIVGTDEDENGTAGGSSNPAPPTTSTSANGTAATGAQEGIPYGGAGGGFAGGAGQGSGASGAPPVSAPASPTAPGGGGGYANLSQYLQANQTTGGTTGQAAADFVQGQATGANAANQQYSQDASNDIANAVSGLGQSQSVLGGIQTQTDANNQGALNAVSAGTYNYTAPTAAQLAGDSSSALAAIAAQTPGTYTGPTSFSPVGASVPQGADVSYAGPTVGNWSGQTATDYANANNLGNALGGTNGQGGYAGDASQGQSGVSALLNNAYTSPGYTAGENSLDAFLAGGNPTGQAALQGVSGLGLANYNAYNGINSLLGNAVTAGQNEATATNDAYANAVTSDQQAALAQDQAAMAAAQGTSSASAKAAAAAATAAQAQQAANATKVAANAPVPTTKGSPQAQVGNATKQAAGAVKGSLSAASLANQAKTSGPSPDDNLAKLGSAVPTALNSNTGKQAINSAKQVVGSVNPSHWAFGGKVPSYSKLLSKLGR
jgi:hypothetical protein